ncbi:hypothetical protein KAR91_07410 [Candidatus Pacearchaeota archaeon]|nr:hypothetical protein [Candidatus Pacearchaeota archaeon]
MPISFLFSFSTLYNGLLARKTDSEIIVTKDAIEKAFEISQENQSSCCVYSSSQDIDKIKRSLKGDQQTRFEWAIEKEGSTQGIQGFTFGSSEVLSESGKTLSYKSDTIIICKEDEKKTLHSNTRIKPLTPAEFLAACEEAEELLDLLLFKDAIYLDYLTMTIFKKDMCKRLKIIFRNLNNNSDSESDEEEEASDSIEKEEMPEPEETTEETGNPANEKTPPYKDKFE